MSSNGPGLYMLDTPYPAGCNPCYEADPYIRLQQRGIRSDTNPTNGQSLVDVESNLFNIDRQWTKCEGAPFFQEDASKLGSAPATCDRVVEDCRLENPPSTLRGTGWNRWEYLPQNPQDKVEIPFAWNINYRMVAKDNHRPFVQQPLNQTPSLPNPQPDTCESAIAYPCSAPTRGRTWIPEKKMQC